MDFHGQMGARLMLGQSVRGFVPKSTSWFVKIVDPALLYMVDRHLNAFEKIWVDRVMQTRYWKLFMEGLEKEWERSLIMVWLLFSFPLGFRAADGDRMYHTDADSLF